MERLWKWLADLNDECENRHREMEDRKVLRHQRRVFRARDPKHIEELTLREAMHNAITVSLMELMILLPGFVVLFSGVVMSKLSMNDIAPIFFATIFMMGMLYGAWQLIRRLTGLICPGYRTTSHDDTGDAEDVFELLDLRFKQRKFLQGEQKLRIIGSLLTVGAFVFCSLWRFESLDALVYFDATLIFVDQVILVVATAIAFCDVVVSVMNSVVLARSESNERLNRALLDRQRENSTWSVTTTEMEIEPK